MPPARPRFDALTRRLTLRGFEPSTTGSAGAVGRLEDAGIRPATLIDAERLTTHPVGRPEPHPGPIAFLDGVQHHRIVGYRNALPLIAARIGAAVLLRTGRRLHAAVVTIRDLILGRPAVLEAAGEIEGVGRIAVAEDEPEHPARDLDLARQALDHARGALEVETGLRFRERSDALLIVDGSLAESPAWAADPRMLGVAKSHASLPFAGDDLRRYLGLDEAQRTTVFQPASRRLVPVYSWALRLQSPRGRDPFYGLVRIEAAATPETLARADAYSRWILAERAPVSAPDPRWDRLLYGIRAVERHLDARMAGRSLPVDRSA